MEEYLKYIPDNTRLGVLVSGGADSALLLWALARYKPNNDYVVLTGCRDDDDHYNLYYAEQVVHWVKNNVGLSLLAHSVMIHENRQQGIANRGKYRKRITENYQIQSWINGKTANPEIDLGEGRDLGRDGVGRPIVKDDMIQPFTNIDKSVIVSLYKQHGLLDTLFPLTISCEATTPPRPCGECWWCKEREWAYATI